MERHAARSAASSRADREARPKEDATLVGRARRLARIEGGYAFGSTARRLSGVLGSRSSGAGPCRPLLREREGNPHRLAVCWWCGGGGDLEPQAPKGVDGVQSCFPRHQPLWGVAIRSAHLDGAKGQGLAVKPVSDTIHYKRKLGDKGQLVVCTDGSGSVVQAATTDLSLGHPWARREHRGPWALSVVMSHGIFRIVGRRPARPNSSACRLGSRGAFPEG